MKVKFGNIITVRKNLTERRIIMTNSNKLKAKIAEAGLTMAELAKNIRMSSATFSQKVNGKVRFSQEDIRKIDKELNLTPEEIKDIFLS
jgi:transcriptional regulator with XRE-family HTH domain